MSSTLSIPLPAPSPLPVSFVVRDHQKEAIADILGELASQRQTKLSKKSTVSRKVPPSINKVTSIDARAQSIMACGTGKTMISQRLADALTGHDDVKTSVIGRNTVLVCVPSLSLVKQTLASYLKFEGKPFIPMVVCSASDAIKSAREKAGIDTKDDGDVDEDDGLENEVSTLDQLRAEDHPPTTDAKDVAGFLQKAATDPDRLHIIFSTYHSSKVVADAQKSLKLDGKIHRFALIAADEAHNLTGIYDRDYATILHESKIGADNRVFATATPKLFEKQSDDDADSDSAKSVRIASMDDESLFGPVAHRLPFRVAVEKKLLVNYKTILLEVDQEEIDQFLAKSNHSTGIEIISDEKVMLSKQKDALAKIAMAKVLHELSLRRVISYHSRISDAESFVGSDGNGELSRYVKRTPSLKDFSASLYGESALNIREDCVSSRTKSNLRSEILARFEDETDEPSVLSSVNCLGEGVDVPDLNAVMFVDPRTSSSDIVQIIGRTMRLASEGIEKDVGYIILPVVVDKTKTIEERMEHSSYKKVWAVIKGLMEVDPDFSNELLNVKNLIRSSKAGDVSFEKPFEILKNAILEHVVIVDAHSASTPGEIKNAVANSHVNQNAFKTMETSAYRHLRMSVDKMAAGLVLKIVDECVSISQIRVNVSDLDDVHKHMEAYKTDMGDYPSQVSGTINGTDDTWGAVNKRLRRSNPPSTLSKEIDKLKGVIKIGIKVNESDPVELRGHLETFRADNNDEYPMAKNGGAIKDTDDTWRAVNYRLQNLDPPSSLAKEVSKLKMNSGILTGIKVNVFDPDDLHRHLEIYKSDNGVYPSLRSGPIKDTDETWVAVNHRLGKLIPPSTLAQEIAKLHGLILTGVKVNVSNTDELRDYMDAFKVENGDYPKKINHSDTIKNTDDTWGAVNERLRNLNPKSTLSQEVAKLNIISGTLTGIKVNQSASDELRGYLEAFRVDPDNNDKYPNLRGGPIKGTDDTWMALDARLGKLNPPSSLSHEVIKLSGGIVNEFDLDDVHKHMEAYKTVTGDYPTKRSGPIKDTGDYWTALNARLRSFNPPSSLSQEVEKLKVISGMLTGIKVNESDPDELRGYLDVFRADNGGEYPNNQGGAIKGTDDTWTALNARMRRLNPSSTLSLEVKKLNGLILTGIKVDVYSTVSTKDPIETIKNPVRRQKKM